MSETRKILEMQAKGASLNVKMARIAGWFFIALGGLCILTIIGAIVGIILVGFGAGLIYLSKYLAKQAEAFKGAASEHAEIIENQLKNARASSRQE
jgi:hypothetical protein